MKQLGENKAGPLHRSISKIDVFCDLDDDLLSPPFGQKDPELIDLFLSQSSDGSSIEVINDPRVNDLHKLIGIFGVYHHHPRNMELELKFHRNFQKTAQCLLHGGCLDRKSNLKTPEFRSKIQRIRKR